MPELPDVETFSRLVRDHCRGRTIDEATIHDPGILEAVSPESLARQLKGRRILSSARHGKYLFILLSEGGALFLHFGTNGSLQVVSAGAAEPPYTRLRLHFVGGDGLAYVNPRRLGGAGLCDNPAAFAARSGLGPDALDPALDLDGFAAVLAGSRRDIKAVLMDQKRISGIGNIYSDEILFQARLHPGVTASAVDAETAAKLFQTMRETLENAIKCGAGSETMGERLPLGFLLPRRHPGGRCPRCNTPLAAVKRAGRTGYHCPRCQPDATVRGRRGGAAVRA